MLIPDLVEVIPTSISTAPPLLLENIANLWGAVRLAETTLVESARLLKEDPGEESIGIVVFVQMQLVARLEELRWAIKVDFKHAEAQGLLKRGLNPAYQEATIGDEGGRQGEGIW